MGNMAIDGSRKTWRLETKGNVGNKRSMEKPEDRESHHQEVELFVSAGQRFNLLGPSFLSHLSDHTNYSMSTHKGIIRLKYIIRLN